MNKALVRLIVGFRRFHEKYFLQEESVYQKLASSGQTPKTLLIGCSDSRVDPAILTGAAPGELFVIRNVANLVPPCEPSAIGFHGTSSALEFAVVNLKVENIIVLGHRQCGGIRALMERTPESSKTFISQWMSIAEDARSAVLRLYPKASEEERWRLAETEALKVSLRNLRTFPFVRDAIENRQLNVVAVYFDLEEGKLLEFDEEADMFRPIEI